MKITILRTHTNNCPAFYEPLQRLGHRLDVIVYDELTATQHETVMLRRIDGFGPEVVVMIGAHEDYHGHPVPDVDVLARIGARHRLVHFCCDGAEPVWWPQIQKYYDYGRFALQINIDGVRIGPIGDRGLTMLSPFDHRECSDPLPWAERSIKLGFAGNAGGTLRGLTLGKLVNGGVIVHRPRDSDPTPTGFYDFMRTCAAVWNHPESGSAGARHVKGRVQQAAFAGALVFELRGSPTAQWFREGFEYMPYDDVGDVVQGLYWMAANPKAAEAMALRLRARVLGEHTPEIFWSRVFERLGLGAALVPLQQPPPREWSFRDLEKAEVFKGPPARLVGSIGGINFVEYDGKVYGVPQGIGEMRLERESDRGHPLIKSFDSLDEARQAYR